MSTAYIYNGFGKYETKDGVEGITTKYAGVEFFLPYEQVTPLPDYTFREVDQDKSTPQGEDAGQLVYMNFVVPGQRIAEELTVPQVPVPNRLKGIVQIQGRTTGKFLTVPAGVSAEGRILETEVREVEATKTEREGAAELALNYKKQMIQEYFQSKRERMNGGHGRLFPTGLVKVFMDELNIEDIDDVSHRQKSAGGIDPELLKVILEENRKSAEITAAQLRDAVDSFRKSGRSIERPAKKSNGTAEFKQAYDEAIEAGKSAEEARAAAEEAREAALAG